MSFSKRQVDTSGFQLWHWVTLTLIPGTKPGVCEQKYSKRETGKLPLSCRLSFMQKCFLSGPAEESHQGSLSPDWASTVEGMVSIQFFPHPLSRSVSWLIAGDLSSGTISSSHPLSCILVLLSVCPDHSVYFWALVSMKGNGPPLAVSEPHLVLGGSRGNAFINNHSLLSNRLCSRLCCQVPVGRARGPYLRAAGSCWERRADRECPTSPAHPCHGAGPEALGVHHFRSSQSEAWDIGGVNGMSTCLR